LSWLSGHADADGDPLAGWHVPPGCGLDDDGQQPEDVSCASGQDAARRPPGSSQVSSPVGVEPGAQQASPSAVIRPGHGSTVAICGHEPSAALGPEQVEFAFGSALFATPATEMIAAAAIRIRAAAKIFWRGPQSARCRAVTDPPKMGLITPIKHRMVDSDCTFRALIRPLFDLPAMDHARFNVGKGITLQSAGLPVSRCSGGEKARHFPAVQNVAHGPYLPRRSFAFVSVIGGIAAAPTWYRRGSF
jgi:hypothetical protein